MLGLEGLGVPLHQGVDVALAHAHQEPAGHLAGRILGRRGAGGDEVVRATAVDASHAGNDGVGFGTVVLQHRAGDDAFGDIGSA